MDDNKRKVVVDTCAVMNDNSVIDNLLKENYQVIFNIATIEELDNLKTNKDYSKARQARQAIKAIERNKSSITFDFGKEISEKIKQSPETYCLNTMNDDIIVTCACRNSASILTYDFNVKIKAEILGISTLERVSEKKYLGYDTINATDEEMASIYENPTKNIFGCLTNQYLIINNSNGDYCDMIKWDGEKYSTVASKNIKTMFFGDKMKAKDVYQRMAIDSLMNNTITCITGKAGSGKSLLSLMIAMHLIETGKYERLVILFNPCPVRGASELGYYTGSVVEKAMQSNIGNILITKFGDRYIVDNYISSGKIKLVPMADCRGMEITDNEILWITEAENTTTDLIKICLSRVSSGAKVFIEGDFKQTDSQTYESNNGLRRVVETFAGEEVFGYVDLQNVWRSKIAEIADRL